MNAKLVIITVILVLAHLGPLDCSGVRRLNSEFDGASTIAATACTLEPVMQPR